MTLLRNVARPLLASMFVYGGVNALRNTSAMAARVQPVTDRIAELVESVAPGTAIPTDAETMVRVNGTIHVAFGTSLALGRFPRLSALVLAGTMVPTTVAGHPFWKESDPAAAANQRIHFTKNLSILGGLLMSMLDPDPQKKLLARRAKDKVVQASGSAADALHETAAHLKDALPG
ncbi:DoxX family protein [Mumia zhuanghuii]|uniref:DoxX family protein n=2 Tax=Mumia TaxID=1546255 RepID=A0ABW1QPX7_9ACTN|nr:MULTISPECIES: DoxX family protein [Mumia]KAA1423849.1 DoxX family protein [Mumia zhuanghuii]